MTALRLSSFDSLRANVVRPAYDPARLRTGIVHLGVGNFHRAHLAACTEASVDPRAPDWGIIGASLRSPALRDALLTQDWLYTLVSRDAKMECARVIAVLRGLLVAPENPRAVVDRIAHPDTRIVSLTITEKGYCRDASGALDLCAPEIAHDLNAPAAPASAIGMLHAGMRERMRLGLSGLTVLSCDNLSGNGRMLRALVLQFVEALAADDCDAMADWIVTRSSFPDSMVDRIVPHTTDEHRALVRSLTGLDDAWPVVTEPFTQWVIEDHFVAGRPDWETGGVEFVTDVAPWEAMKLRLLNAAHSALAYLAVPAGLETVDRAIARPEMQAFLRAMWVREVTPTLDASVLPSVPEYCASLLERFANPSIGHRTAQIAMDGSQKLPLRLLPSLRAQRSAGRSTRLLEFALAAWMRFLEGRTEAGAAYSIDDPLAGRFNHLLATSGPRALASVEALLGVAEVFGDDLRADRHLVERLAADLELLRRVGSLAALREVLRG